MENEQAMTAVQPEEAAPIDGVDHAREAKMAHLLQEMTTPEVSPPLTTPDAPAHTAGEVADLTAETMQDEGEATVPDAAPEPDEANDIAPESDDAAKPARNFRGRWDHLNEGERRVVELTTKRGLSLQEACRAVYGTDQPPASVEPDSLDADIARQEAELESLKARKAEAGGDLEAYDRAAEAYLEAREALRELRGQKEALSRQAQTEAEATREAALAAARQRVNEEFPDAYQPGHEFHEACREELDYLRQSGSPLADDPEVEYKVARRLSRTLGYRRAPLHPVETRRAFRPLPVGSSPLESAPAQLERRMASASQSPDAMLDLMREIGTPFEALLPKS